MGEKRLASRISKISKSQHWRWNRSNHLFTGFYRPISYHKFLDVFARYRMRFVSWNALPYPSIIVLLNIRFVPLFVIVSSLAWYALCYCTRWSTSFFPWDLQWWHHSDIDVNALFGDSQVWRNCSISLTKHFYPFSGYHQRLNPTPYDIFRKRFRPLVKFLCPNTSFKLNDDQ